MIEKAIAQMEAWAVDGSHGYDKGNRWVGLWLYTELTALVDKTYLGNEVA